MEDKIRLTCSVCQTSIRVRAATKARFAICPKCQARTPIPDRKEPVPEVVSVEPEEPYPPAPRQDVTQAELAVASPVEEPQAAPVIELQEPVATPVEAPAEPAPEPAAPAAPPPAKSVVPRRISGKRAFGSGRKGLSEEEGEKKGGSKLIWIILIVLVLVGGAAAFYFLKMKK